MAGDINIDVNNATIELIDVSGNIKINNDNGAIRLVSPNVGNLSLESVNGLVSVSLNKLAGNVYDVRTNNGMVNITLPQDVAADLEVTVENEEYARIFL
jgi:DUF4097 and DUF4098 domain-containing protein YvlB